MPESETRFQGPSASPRPDRPSGSRAWWRATVMYEIYVRSFNDSDGNGTGDLRGIIDRLDHLNDGTPGSLGIETIWLSPFYPSPQADFGYDISDYCSVDPVYGTLGDFDELVSRAHARQMRVVIDLVMNHTSDQHEWFLKSRSGPENPYRDWYIWADPAGDGGPPNNWLSSFEECGSAWTLDERTGQYYLHSFMPQQPDLNWRNPQVRKAFDDIWRFWLERGVDGFRVDVAHRLMKDLQLRDNPAELAAARRHLAHPHLRQLNIDLPEVHEVYRDLRKVLDSYGDRFSLGEVPISDDRRLADYFGGDGMDTVFHLAFWEQPWNGEAFREAVDRLAGCMRPGSLPTLALDTHDIPRAIGRFGGTARARVAALMQFTLRGVPCVLYGDEIGMTNVPPPPGELLDVDDRDRTRVPMHWEGTGLGFSSSPRPWLPYGPDLAEINVESQAQDPGSLLHLYRSLIWYRRTSQTLQHGDYQPIQSSAESFVYLRSTSGERLLIALNFTSDALWLTLPTLQAEGARLEFSTRSYRQSGEMVQPGPVLLAADEGVVLRLADVAEAP